jgi:hypothetical protein
MRLKRSLVSSNLFWGLHPHTLFRSFCLDTKRTKKIKKKSVLAFTLQGPQAATIFSGLRTSPDIIRFSAHGFLIIRFLFKFASHVEA